MEKKDDGLNAISPRLHGENLFRIKEPFVKKKGSPADHVFVMVGSPS